MAVPYRILVIYVVVCLCPGPSWPQYAKLKKSDLDVSLFDSKAFKNDDTICSDVLQKKDPNFFRYLQPLSDYLYVGAMNCLLRLHQSDLAHKDSESFPVNADDNWKCGIQGKSPIQCQNHIRAVMPDVNDEKKLFVCGTGGFAPTKYTLNDVYLNQSEPKEDGSKYCPFDPLDNVTSIHVESGNLGNKPAHYFGLYGDFIKYLPVLFRPSFNISIYPDLVSAKGDVTWLHAPQFVGSFNVDYSDKGGQVFFFFREIAEEYTESENKIFSRVAKVCKNDRGGGSIERNQKKWLSYQKARLNCSLPGFEPYYWDDIYDVYEAGDKFYALFFKLGGDHNSSAVCVYTKSEIFRVFGGSFRRLVNKTWETLPLGMHPDPRLDNCYLHDTRPSSFDGPQTVSRYQLMAENVDSLYGRPIYSKTGVQFLKIVVHPDKHGSGSNIYLATDSGDVHSLFLYNCGDSDFELWENAVFSPLDNPIWTMKLLENKTSIYLGTDYEVAKINYTVCTEYKKKDNCIHDVLCYWCNNTKGQASCRSRNDDSCSQKVTYNNIYTTNGDQCKTSDIVKVLDEEVVSTPHMSLKGLYTTLNINYGLQRAGPTVWYKNSAEIHFDEDGERFFLANDGSLIIKNVTINDQGRFKAFDTVYRQWRQVAEYDVIVNPGESEEDLIKVWKQAFIDWSSSFRTWESCSKDFLKDQCSP